MVREPYTRSLLLPITVAVLVAHALFLWWLTASTTIAVIPAKARRQLVVKTVALQPKEDVVSVAMAAPPPKKQTPPPPKKQVPKKKKRETPPPPKTKTAVKKKEEKPKLPQEDKKRKALLAKAQENIAKIGKNNDKSSEKRAKKIDDYEVASEQKQELSDEEIGYRDELAGRLRLMLSLPDYGEVKIKLTLNRDGTVHQVKTVSSQSSKNSNYVESTVPTLKFPGFGRHFKNNDRYTFLVTLQNE